VHRTVQILLFVCYQYVITNVHYNIVGSIGVTMLTESILNPKYVVGFLPELQCSVVLFAVLSHRCTEMDSSVGMYFIALHLTEH